MTCLKFIGELGEQLTPGQVLHSFQSLSPPIVDDPLGAGSQYAFTPPSYALPYSPAASTCLFQRTHIDRKQGASGNAWAPEES